MPIQSSDLWHSCCICSPYHVMLVVYVFGFVGTHTPPLEFGHHFEFYCIFIKHAFFPSKHLPGGTVVTCLSHFLIFDVISKPGSSVFLFRLFISFYKFGGPSEHRFPVLFVWAFNGMMISTIRREKFAFSFSFTIGSGRSSTGAATAGLHFGRRSQCVSSQRFVRS